MAFKLRTVGGLPKGATSRRAVTAGPELQVDEKKQNVPSQKVTVNLSAFMRKKAA